MRLRAYSTSGNSSKMASSFGATANDVPRLAVGARVTLRLMVPSSSSGTNSVPKRGSKAMLSTNSVTAVRATVLGRAMVNVNKRRYTDSIGLSTTLSLRMMPRLNAYTARAGTATSATTKADSMANMILIAMG